MSRAHTAQHSKERLAGPPSSEEHVFTTLQHPSKRNRVMQEYARPHERAVKTITEATPWQDLYFNEEQPPFYGRSRAVAFAKNLHQKYDTDQRKELPSVVYEDDSRDEQADSPGPAKTGEEPPLVAPEAKAETVRLSTDNNTEVAAISGKIKSLEQPKDPQQRQGERPSHYYSVQKKGSADASNLQRPSMRT